MKTCRCGAAIPNWIRIDGKRRNTSGRTRCLDCLPWGTSLYRKKTEEEKKASKRQKWKVWYERNRQPDGTDPIRKRRTDRKRAITNLVGGCQLCGYKKCQRNLTFHHLWNKEFEISSREFQFSLSKVLNEIRKCIVVCHNCHGEVHEGLISTKLVKEQHQVFVEVLAKLTKMTWTELVYGASAAEALKQKAIALKEASTCRCGKSKFRTSAKCKACAKATRISKLASQRSAMIGLLDSIDHNYRLAGKRLGISDKAVKKRCLAMGIEPRHKCFRHK